MTQCFCGETHDPDTRDPVEAWRNLGHLVLTEARIPEFVQWLSERLAVLREDT